MNADEEKKEILRSLGSAPLGFARGHRLTARGQALLNTERVRGDAIVEERFVEVEGDGAHGSIVVPNIKLDKQANKRRI